MRNGDEAEQWYSQERAEEELEERRGLALTAWMRRFLPRHCERPASALHRWLSEELGRATQERGQRVNVLGPRGSAKSTVATLGYVLRSVVEEEEPYVWIVSDTRAQAWTHLENVRTELEENEALRAAYGAAERGGAWRRERLTLVSGAVVEGLGAGQKLRGRRRGERRPSLIVCDDVENERWVESERNRMQLREWFHGTLVPAGDERTNVVHLATALHPNSLGLELARNPGWRSRVFRALVKEPEERELWERWEELWRGAEGPAGARRFYEEHREAMTRGAEVLWPEAEDLEALMRFRMEQGAGAFAREKQNAPEEALGAEWPGRCFAEETWVEGWPNEAVVRAIGVDPSVGGTGRRGDATAIVLIAVDAEGVIYAGADLQRRPAGEIAAEVAALAAAFRAELIAVETNLFQQLLGDALERALAGAGLWNVAVLRIENRERKSVRIRRLGHYLAAGRMRWVRSMRGTEALVRQLREFPGGAHDDGPDALEMAVRAAGEWCRER